MKVNLTIGIPVWLDFIFTCPLLLYRLWKYGYTFRRIDLGEGQWTIVAPQDFYWLNNFKWCVVGCDERMYAARVVRKIEFGRLKTVYLHRVIMSAPKGLLVDHRNNNGLDNRRNNLRLATHSQNMINRPKTKSPTTSRFVGVYFDKDRSKWVARIHLNNKCIWLGRLDNEIDAAKAYDKAAKQYHGDFARLNFPEEAPVS